MEDFLKWAFDGDIHKSKNINVIYQCYLIYCELFDYEPLQKFKFMELYNSTHKKGIK